MGNQKQKWTAEEEDALHCGVQKYGAGKWKNILRDPEFAPSLTSRSNIDLKDKWRNLNVVTGQGSNIKSRTLKHKLPAPTAVTTPDPTLQFLLIVENCYFMPDAMAQSRRTKSVIATAHAYTMELEQEVTKLKEENEELQKKQEEIMEMQKNQVWLWV
ncbi:telomere repeat-binding factor 5-like [Lotus japonicus]|uniref:telomere repeat-binding factor 5-like n=1 Tax=Lotus japonicus TaxID=34305 RepID=UPI00258BC84C|nr:telomere repeat-binding factor 5-like [Lotus japonicus]